MTHLAHPMLPTICLAAIPDNALVLCVTQRLAQQLVTDHDRLSTATIWRTLHTATLSHWFSSLFDQLTLRDQAPTTLRHVQLMTPFQEQLVWEKIIREQLDESTQPLFDIASLTRHAIQAHQLTLNWDVPVGLNTLLSEEQHQFEQWQKSFLGYCQQHQLVDSSRLAATLIAHWPSLPAALRPACVVFAGFDHFTPLEQRLQAQLRHAAAPCYRLDEPQIQSPSPIRRLQPAHLNHECELIAHWAKQHLSAHPKARLGIVVPDLKTYQRPLEYALEDALTPDQVIARNAHQPRPFNTSLGQALADLPLVDAALSLLRLLANPPEIEQSQIAELLHSPYWSLQHASECDARARLDAAYRARMTMTAPLGRLTIFGERFIQTQHLHAPGLQTHLKALATLSQETQGKHLPSVWHPQVTRLLADAGWLAAGHLNSHEFQTRQSFRNILCELDTLDAFTGKLHFAALCSLLNRLCQERLFQPKTQGSPPIQILGVLESTGQCFDALWFAGLTESSWPPPAHPNPLLSLSAQRQQQAPNASAMVQLNFAQRIQSRLCGSAPEIILSAPESDGDTHLQPSVLIRDYVLEATPLTDAKAHNEQHTEEVLEAIDDARAPKVSPGTHVRGGTSLLRAQALCPAWGYYQYRLGATALQTPSNGLDARQRGTLVHAALQAFWTNTTTLTRLRQMDDTERAARIDEAIKAAFHTRHETSDHEPLKPRQQALEHHRLRRLLTAWLAIEAQRPEDFTVRHCELPLDSEIHGIKIHITADRIDTFANGDCLIIDYKTGAHIDTKNWSQARITEPQLPIYAVLTAPEALPIAGVAFGLVNLKKLGFKGLSDTTPFMPGVDPLDSRPWRKHFSPEQFADWTDVLAHWRSALTGIAEEIYQGDAKNCFSKESDLAYCDVLPLLRLPERNLLLELARNAAPKSSAP